MIIFFDIDSTLIDTKWLITERVLPAMATAAAVGDDTFQALVDRYYQTLEDSTDFNPWDLIAFISTHSATDRKKLEAAYFDPVHFQAALYDDVVPTLEKLSSDPEYTLGLYSQGYREYQLQKLELGGVKKYFPDEDLQIIARRKSATDVLERIPEGSVVIDDHSRFLQPLAAKRPDLQLFWIYRGDPAEYASKIPATVTHLPTLHSLTTNIKQE